MIENGFLRRIIFRLRPSLAEMEGMEQVYNTLVMVPIVAMGPFAIAGLVWLVAITRLSEILDHLPLMAVLMAVLFVIHSRNYTLHIETRSGDLVRVTGSLDTIVVWSALLIAGPMVLWIVVIEHALQIALTARSERRRNITGQSWMRLSMAAQETSGVAINLVSLAVFRALGGAYPLEGLALADWGPAIAALVLSSLLTQVLYYPLMRAMGTISGSAQANSFSAFVLVSTLLMAPFSVLGALIYSEGAPGLFALYLVGIALVNLLAHTMSRTAEHNQQRARELSRLETLGEALIQAPPDLSTLEDVLTEHVPGMFPMDRFELRLFEPDNPAQQRELAWPALRLIDNPERPPLAEDDWKRLRAANQTHITLPNVSPPDVSITYGDALLVPIATDDPGEEGGERERLLGGIALLRHRDNGKTIHSLSALQALASQIGSAHYRANVHQETLTAQKMAQELELAGRIQAKFLPASVPQLAGWDIAAGLTPARQTSGDFYDFVVFEDGRLGMVVADVADKGTGAALYMALSRTLIRTFALQTPDAPEVALRAANERLLTDAESDQFVTVFYGVLDPTSGVLTYANAGHNPGYILRANGTESITALPKTGVPLGILEDMDWQRASVTLNCGDTLVLYTDGVNEAQDLVNAEFGDDRLCDTVRAHLDQPATAIHRAVTHAVQDFVGAAPQFDDITLMIAVRK